MLFGWKKTNQVRTEAALPSRLLQKNAAPAAGGLIRFERVSLPPSIENLSLEIPLGSWTTLHGDDDFAKALFCDLCFSYILPESGRVQPVLKGADVSFLGRSNTTYGRSLVDHLACGVRDNAKELMEFVARHVLTERFRRHLSAKSPLEFANGKSAQDLELDERDFLEIAEANLLLQRRPAAVIDTDSDFYQIALEQGFRHSEAFLRSGKTILWLVGGSANTGDARPWLDPRYADVPRISLSFPSGSRAGYIN